MLPFSNYPKFSFIEDYDPKTKIKVLYVKEAKRPDCCHKCGSLSFVKKTTNKPRTVYDVIDGKPVKILITQNRYLCSSCHKTFAATFYPDRKKFTSDFEDFIAQTMVNENLTYTDIRNRYGISKGALSKILNSYIDRFNERSFKFESCKHLYFHKFVYNKKDCCCICGSNLNDTIDLKLLGIYREYSPEIIKEFYHRISTLDNIKIIFHNYDAFVTETLSQKFRATVAIHPKDFLSCFWEIANKDYNLENDDKNNSFKETMKKFYNAISKELVSPNKNTPDKILNLFSRQSGKVKSFFSQPMSPLISNRYNLNKVFFFTKEEMKIAPICKLIQKFRSSNTPFELMYIRIMILSKAVRDEIKTLNLGKYIIRDPENIYYVTGDNSISTQYKDNIPVHYVDVQELVAELEEDPSLDFQTNETL